MSKKALGSFTFWITAAALGMTGWRGAALWARDTLPPSLPKASEAWGGVTGKQLLCMEGDRIWSPGPNAVRILGIERREPQAWTVRDKGHLSIWKIFQRSDRLRTEVSGHVTEYRRLDSVPAECGFRVVPIRQARQVSRERADAISREIHEHMLKDEKAMEAGVVGPTSPVVIENRKYLEKLIKELGWIDLHRFGPEGSGNAIVLAQHSEDLPLMTTILPLVEKDFKNSAGDPVMYAILYDALQLRLGQKQRFGTQTGLDSDGNPMVLPLEDASKVEQLRKEIGLPSLEEYLKLASEGLYSGKPIRMPRADE